MKQEAGGPDQLALLPDRDKYEVPPPTRGRPEKVTRVPKCYPGNTLWIILTALYHAPNGLTVREFCGLYHYDAHNVSPRFTELNGYTEPRFVYYSGERRGGRWRVLRATDEGRAYYNAHKSNR